MQPYVFGIIGLSGTDTAILVERLIPELVRRGHRIGTLREDAGERNTGEAWRYHHAGATSSVVAGPSRTALLRSGPSPEPSTLLPLLGDVDLVLVEGFFKEKWPKLEVHRGIGPLACLGDPWLVAVAGPVQPRGCPAPWYHWDEVSQIANAIENASSLGRIAR